jgi:hypothetical protein
VVTAIVTAIVSPSRVDHRRMLAPAGVSSSHLPMINGAVAR